MRCLCLQVSSCRANHRVGRRFPRRGLTEVACQAVRIKPNFDRKVATFAHTYAATLLVSTRGSLLAGTYLCFVALIRACLAPNSNQPSCDISAM